VCEVVVSNADEALCEYDKTCMMDVLEGKIVLYVKRT
jgi:hypothetical protein